MEYDTGRSTEHSCLGRTGLNFELKYQVIRRPRKGIASNGELREMISCKQMQWTQV
jgi:hypothetical protein